MSREYYYRKADITFDFPDGDVSQVFSYWNNFLRDTNFTAVNVNMGQTRNAEIEQYVLDNIASYGRQLGRIGEALNVVINHLDLLKKTSGDDQRALVAFQSMLSDIESAKQTCK